MSHNIGRVLNVSPAPIGIGPDFGAPNSHNFAHDPAPAPGTRFLLLHFTNANLPGSSRLEVQLGYSGEVDVFTSADGSEFWTRPIKFDTFAGGLVPVEFIPNGAVTGGAQLDSYGRAQRINEGARPETYTNCDLFLQDSPYVEPDYDPFWICPPDVPPDWMNFDLLPDGDPRKVVGQASCMIVSRHGNYLSTCSGTLIASDLVFTAGHCVSVSSWSSPLDSETIRSSSVVFGFSTNGDGTRPGGYAPKTFKVVAAEEFGYGPGEGKDYAILKIVVPPGGTGITPVPMRTDLPSAGEHAYAVHHPNGAVKKYSLAGGGLLNINSASSSGIVTTLDVAGGSSGSGLYDMFGNVVGTLSNGQCTLSYYPSASALADIATPPPPPDVLREIMVVFDRSGSMSQLTPSGLSKIDEARDAASLFLSMVRKGEGHEAGLVSFSTTAHTDSGLVAITVPNVNTLIGPPPHSTGIIGGLIASGTTSIGHGLQFALAEFSAGSVRDRVILLLTDGMQNTPPMIADVEAGLINRRLCIIGYGDEANLNGPLLTELAIDHDGAYTVAGDELALKKFFAACFGDIFEAGFLMDPEYVLSPKEDESRAIPFVVCGETTATVVLGWDTRETQLLLEVRTPGGEVVNPVEEGIEQDLGHTWRYLRILLPYKGEQDGTWTVRVKRPTGSEFPSPNIDVRFFINIIAQGGPALKPLRVTKRVYTGDTLNPLVWLSFPSGTTPPNAKVQLTVKRPKQSIGNIVAETGLKPATTIAGDTIPPRNAALNEAAAGPGPLVEYEELNFDLYDDGAHGDGAMEPDGVFGNPLSDLLTAEGSYTFHAKATFGEACTATREAVWSVYADTGIDPNKSDILTTPVGRTNTGKDIIQVTLTPRDQYGNLVGPGRGPDLPIEGVTGTTVTGPLLDLGDGRYQTEIEHDPTVDGAPGIIINPNGHTPAVFCDVSGKTGRRHCYWCIWLLILLLILLVLYMLF